MDEIVPGLLHWTTFHERIEQPVSSYFLTETRTLLDPMEPEAGLDAFEGRDPSLIVLTNRHHLRHSKAFAERFGCEVRAPAAGMHEFDEGDPVKPYDPGEELAPGVRAHVVGGICPDDNALHIDVAGGALAFADGLINAGGEPSFVPDFLMGDDPEQVKRDLTDSFRRLLDLEFEHLLFAHGDPLVGDGHARLARFVA